MFWLLHVRAKFAAICAHSYSSKDSCRLLIPMPSYQFRQCDSENNMTCLFLGFFCSYSTRKSASFHKTLRTLDFTTALVSCCSYFYSSRRTVQGKNCSLLMIGCVATDIHENDSTNSNENIVLFYSLPDLILLQGKQSSFSFCEMLLSPSCLVMQIFVVRYCYLLSPVLSCPVVLSSLVLSCPGLFCCVLLCPLLMRPVLSCNIQSYCILSSSVQFYHVLSSCCI